MGKGSIYFKKIIWAVGLVILVNLSLDFRIQIQQTAQENFNAVPLFWFDVINSILFGLYISLLLVKKWSIKINHSLLWCVAVPCLLLLLIYPTLSTLASYELLPESFSYTFISTWLFKTAMSTPIVVGIVAGMTMTLSLFNNHSNVTK